MKGVVQDIVNELPGLAPHADQLQEHLEEMVEEQSKEKVTELQLLLKRKNALLREKMEMVNVLQSNLDQERRIKTALVEKLKEMRKMQEFLKSENAELLSCMEHITKTFLAPEEAQNVMRFIKATHTKNTVKKMENHPNTPAY